MHNGQQLLQPARNHLKLATEQNDTGSNNDNTGWQLLKACHAAAPSPTIASPQNWFPSLPSQYLDKSYKWEHYFLLAFVPQSQSIPRWTLATQLESNPEVWNVDPHNPLIFNQNASTDNILQPLIAKQRVHNFF
jgi:hypothetical protein